MKLDDLLLLAEVAEAGSLSAAARRLQTPKATLSRRLLALEQAVAQRLFVPGARRLSLSPLGQALAERAQRHREDLDETRRWLGSQESTPRGLLRLSVAAEFASLVLAEPLARFSQRYPEIRLDVDTSPQRADPRRDAFDVVVRLGPLEDSDLVARPLMELTRGLYASPSYLHAQGRPLRPSDMARHTMVVLSQSLAFEQWLLKGRRRERLDPQGALQTNSIALVHSLTKAHSGIAIFPHGLVSEDVAAGRLERVLPDWEINPLPVTLLTASRKLMPLKVRALIDHLLESTATRQDKPLRAESAR